MSSADHSNRLPSDPPFADRAVNNLNKLHVAIIMDGNGRWAARSGRPRSSGHVMGARPVRAIVEASVSCGIDVLTLYAFSSDNWKRPPREVSLLMKLFRRFLVSEIDKCVTNGVKISVIGRRDRLPKELLKAIETAESSTRYGNQLDLRIAVDYSSRDSIMQAALNIVEQAMFSGDGIPSLTRDQFAQKMNTAIRAGSARDVDLLIRTGGEQRLSDFLLWECAYAELYFTERMWPEFTVADLKVAVAEYYRRDRRYGTIGEQLVAAG